MKVVKSFFLTVKNSIYGPEFYRSVTTRPLKHGVWYMAGLMFLVTLPLGVQMTTGLLEFLSVKTVNETVAAYPDDLIFTLKDGEVSVNQEEPIFIGKGEDGKDHLIVIDTKSALTGDQLKQYSTFALVKKDLVIAESGNGSRIIPLNDVDDFTLTKERLTGWGEKAKPYLTPAAIGLSIFIFVMMFVFSWGGQLMYTLFPAAVVFLAAKVFKKKFTFKHSYKVALYATTLPILGETLIRLIGGGPTPMFSFTALTLLIILLNISQKQKSETQEVSA